ncbi:MAG: 30S ribosomal protein S31 [Roseivirga sp.]|jgi:30S ribosomal protein S31
MGRGDIKTKKGKISNGSYGVKRPKDQGKSNDHKPPAEAKK